MVGQLGEVIEDKKLEKVLKILGWDYKLLDWSIQTKRRIRIRSSVAVEVLYRTATYFRSDVWRDARLCD